MSEDLTAGQVAGTDAQAVMLSHDRAQRSHSHHGEESQGQRINWLDLGRITFVALAAVASWAGLWKHFASFDFISLVATLIGGYPIFREAFEDIRARHMTMELSMTIALIAAMAIGEFRTALIIALFVLQHWAVFSAPTSAMSVRRSSDGVYRARYEQKWLCGACNANS